MAANDSTNGKRELRKAMLGGFWPFVSIGVFSFFVNLLMLTGPLFMLQVYDRVLGSRSEETLAALLILVAGLFALMGMLDFARARVAARLGAAFQTRLDARVFAATLRAATTPAGRAASAPALRNLESVQKLLSSPALFALIDIPWAPLFILAIFTFHPMLGWLALGGGALIVAIAVTNRFMTYRPVGDAARKTLAGDALAATLREQGETVRGLGMESAALARWQKLRNTALEAHIRSSDMTGSFGTLTKTLRFFLQSAMLALGAWLVLQNQMTAGAMIAASIMMGRALAPVEQTIAQWPLIQRARNGWRDLATFLSRIPEVPERTRLPRPKALLALESVTAVPPGAETATLRGAGFTLQPGQALGIIGPSASGKSTLARVLAGIWPPAAGKLRLDGATLDQYGSDLGRHIGYLPQDVTLFEATIAENIARLSTAPDSAAVVAAAKKAGAHDMILKLPQGYDTVITGSGRLSGGQKQRIGLARAMFGEPVLLVLDEPNANLDAQGSEALNRAIRDFKSAGGSVIIMAHRPAGIAECDLLMVLQDGIPRAFGPRDEVLRAQVQNHSEVAETLSPEGTK